MNTSWTIVWIALEKEEPKTFVLAGLSFLLRFFEIIIFVGEKFFTAKAHRQRYPSFCSEANFIVNWASSLVG